MDEEQPMPTLGHAKSPEDSQTENNARGDRKSSGQRKRVSYY